MNKITINKESAKKIGIYSYFIDLTSNLYL